MTKTIEIEGGKPLSGEVVIGGSKNAASAILPALCLIDENEKPSVIRNIPNIEDMDTMCSILGELGLVVYRDKQKKELVVQGKIKNNALSSRHANKIRASNLFLGALLAIKGESHMPFCGGDKIGERPMDIHYYVFEQFGIETAIAEGGIHCKVKRFPLKGTTIYLRYPSVGATENAMMLASRAEGTTYIYHAACEPEITDLAIVLSKMGVRVSGAGTPIIRIQGTKRTLPIEHEVIPDRLEFSTYMLAIACTKGKGRLLKGIPEHCLSVIQTLKDAGVEIEAIKDHEEDVIFVDATKGDFKAIQVNAMPYPGIPTDIQPLLSVFATQCKGLSVIDDSVFKERFSYVSEYFKMGVDAMHYYDRLCITGPQEVKHGMVEGNDIRSVSALVLAALIAKKRSQIIGYEHIIRGYEDFVEKLRGLGAVVSIGDVELR